MNVIEALDGVQVQAHAAGRGGYQLATLLFKLEGTRPRHTPGISLGEQVLRGLGVRRLRLLLRLRNKTDTRNEANMEEDSPERRERKVEGIHIL